MRIPKFILSFLAISVSTSIYANNHHTVVAPSCLLSNIHKTTLASSKKLQLIQTNDAGIEALVLAKRNLKSCGGFMDVTQAWHDHPAKMSASAFLNTYEMTPKPLTATNYAIQYNEQVAELFKQINPQSMWSRLQALSSYKDRNSNSDNGLKVANEIKAEVDALATTHHRTDVTSFFVPTGRFKQPSVVVKIGDSNEPGIVIGGHMDTLSSWSENKPGADDDGSGTVTVLEVARVLLSSDMKFKRPIYLVWYAAEEVGLVGSQYVVSYFQKQNIPVANVLQLDMTGYASKNDLTMWLYDDYTNKDLTSYLENLINTYVHAPIAHDKCGYACSDHASWTQKGYPAAMPFEASFTTDNPNIHTSNDTLDKLSLTHMTHFAQLAVSFAVELAEPVG